MSISLRSQSLKAPQVKSVHSRQSCVELSSSIKAVTRFSSVCLSDVGLSSREAFQKTTLARRCSEDICEALWRDGIASFLMSSFAYTLVL
jgi:hypothetical protein